MSSVGYRLLLVYVKEEHRGPQQVTMQRISDSVIQNQPATSTMLLLHPGLKENHRRGDGKIVRVRKQGLQPHIFSF